MTNHPTCERCGHQHLIRAGNTACAGHLSSDPTRPCGKAPMKGTTVCRNHGGAARQVRAAAERTQAEETAAVELRRGLTAAYGAEVPDIDPAEAMLQAVSWKYAEVSALRFKVSELDDNDLTWGVTREKSGGDDHGTTEEAKPNIWWSMLRSAEDQLVKFAAAARAAGCDERRVRLAEDQGRMLEQVVRLVLGGLNLTAEQQSLVPTVVPAAFRQIGAGS